MHVQTSALALATIVFLGACADRPTAPHAPLTPSLAVKAGPTTTTRHVVVFTGNGVPTTFAARVNALGGTVRGSYPSVGVAIVEGLSSSAAATLAKDKGIDAVTADAMFKLDDMGRAAVSEAGFSIDAPSATSQTNPGAAFFFRRQWTYVAIDATGAWKAGRTGSSNVRVAIIDSGIDYTYPDLAGLVDLTRSRSFTTADDELIDAVFPGRSNLTDIAGHGTHVASTVSSLANVVAGVTSRTTLMAVKVLDGTGSGTFGAVFEGIMYAADNGADVINMSLGANFLKAGSKGFVSALSRAVNYAYSRGVTTVVSAGNEAIDLDHAGNLYSIFCNSSTVICVAATGPNRSTTVNGPFFPSLDAPAVYSNFGRSAINVAAPGGNFVPPSLPTEPITSLVYVWQACSRTWLLYDEETGRFSPTPCSTDLAHVYTLGAIGTSMASPHVAGLAALLVEQYGRNPGLIAARIQQSADDLGQPGTDPHYGKGRINVARAVGALR